MKALSEDHVLKSRGSCLKYFLDELAPHLRCLRFVSCYSRFIVVKDGFSLIKFRGIRGPYIICIN
jgi:hypothetical protein